MSESTAVGGVRLQRRPESSSPRWRSAASLALREARILADWLAWAGGLVVALLVVNAFVQLVGGPDSTDALGTASFPAFVAWVLAASILLSRSSARAAAAPSATLVAGSAE